MTLVGDRVEQVVDAQPSRRQVAGVARDLLSTSACRSTRRASSSSAAPATVSDAALAVVEELDPEVLLEFARLLAYCNCAT